MGLITGAVTRKGTAVWLGTFFSKNVDNGDDTTLTGRKIKPIKGPKQNSPIYFWEGLPVDFFRGDVDINRPEK